MGWYGEHIFPRLMEWVMGGEEFQKQRSLVLAQAYGTVLGNRLRHRPQSPSLPCSPVEPPRHRSGPCVAPESRGT